jgi:uncharacterized Zn-binding protein involved in type VI secretion
MEGLMPGQGRLGDNAQTQQDAHGCPGCPHPGVGPAISGSPTVFVNGRPALRVDDIGIHGACCGANMWQAQQGSATVFINGKAAFRKDDPTRHCGSQGKLIEGSADVTVGDASGGGGGGAGDGSGSSSSAAGGSSGGAGKSGGAQSAQGGSATSASSGGGSSAAGNSGSSPGGAAGSSAHSIEPDAIEVHVLDAAGKPVKALYYELTLPDGAKRTGKTDNDGVLKITALIQKGDCTIVFPDIDDGVKKKS